MYVYILKSKNLNWFYVGMTEDVENRLCEHNSGKVRSTQYRKPYRLIYFEQVTDRVQARQREKYLKSGSGKEWIKEKYHSGGFSSAG